MANAREVAHALLTRVSRDDSYVNLLLPSFLRNSGISDQDRGLVQELAYGALRWQLQYDSIIDFLAGSKQIDDSVRIALRLGMHQLFRMRIPAHAAINETVELVKKLNHKAGGFANAILRNAERRRLEPLLSEITANKTRIGELSIRHSHPEWVISALLDALEFDGRNDIESVLAANNETPMINLAALSKVARERLVEAGLEPSTISPIGFVASGNPESHLGLDVRVQDQGSQLVALALLELAKPDGRFLDMCSGPGGKSAVVLSGISEAGRLDCFEPTPHRANLVRQAVGNDARVQVIEKQGQEVSVSNYDAVLLDAPCTGLGSLRRKPESRWRKQPSQLKQLTSTQAELLTAGINSLKPGGVLLYSTCSPVIAETNTQISDLLSSRNDCELVDLKPVLMKLSPSLTLNSKRKTIQLWTDLHSTDSMFMAAIRRK